MSPPPYPPGNRATVQPSVLTLEEYAAAKGRSVEELNTWGVSESQGKIRIPYRNPDGSESKNHSISLIDGRRTSILLAIGFKTHALWP